MLSRIRLRQKSAFFIEILTDLSTVTVLLSHETKNLDSRASTSNDSLRSSERSRRLIQHSFFKYFNPKLSIKKRIKPGELDHLRNEMTTAEIGHLIAFGFVMIFACVMVFKGKFLFALIMTIINILMNLYPSLLQQENKRRIDQFKNKMNSKILGI